MSAMLQPPSAGCITTTAINPILGTAIEEKDGNLIFGIKPS